MRSSKNTKGLTKELEEMCKVKAKVIAVIIGALRTVTHKLEKWFQQILRTTSDIPIQNNVILGTVKITCRTLNLSDLFLEDSRLRDDHHPSRGFFL